MARSDDISEDNSNFETVSPGVCREKINYRKLCVTKQKDKIHYPKSIPKERGTLATRIMIILCLVLFLGDICINVNSINSRFMIYAIGIAFAITLQIIYRLILMCEEYVHLISRYDGSLMTLLKDTFHFNTSVWITFVICSFYCVNCIGTYGVYQAEDMHYLRLFIPITFIYFLTKLLRLSDGPLRDSLWVAENNGLDYGSGMAYSFFYGYLNLVLPKTGGEDKHLAEIMRDYEDRNGIKFDVHKLFILIPQSLTCFVSLKNEFSPSIEESSSLEEKVITVAGVQNRVYKNAVYKIVLENGKRCYVSAEYATPLKTFKDVFDKRGVHSEHYNKLKKDIILQFYLTLGKVLEEKGLSQHCELIYYDDAYIGSNGPCYYDVGKIIYGRLKELKKKRD